MEKCIITQTDMSEYYPINIVPTTTKCGFEKSFLFDFFYIKMIGGVLWIKFFIIKFYWNALNNHIYSRSMYKNEKFLSISLSFCSNFGRKKLCNVVPVPHIHIKQIKEMKTEITFQHGIFDRDIIRESIKCFFFGIREK